MFGIYLTTLQKLEVAFICVALGVAGVFVFYSMKPTFDKTITSWQLKRPHPVNDNARGDERITATNPVDPKKYEIVTVFACADGQLQISVFPNDSNRHTKLKWTPEKRQPGLVYQYYQDPLAPIDQVKDAFRHALAYATYNFINGKQVGLLGKADLTEAQIAQARTLSDTMMNEVKIVNSAVDDGTYFPKLMDQVMKALAAYNAKPGDPQKDAAKADLARKVLEAVAAFEKQVEADKIKSAEKYMNLIEKMLSAEQKQKLIDAYKVATQPPAPRNPVTARRGAAPPAGTAPRGGAATAGRGAAGTRGARGATTPAGG